MFKTSARRVVLCYALVGAVVGYTVLHPYAMVVYGLYENGDPAIWETVLHSFRLRMVPMGIPFGGFGAAVGILYALWGINEKKRLEGERMIQILKKQLSQFEERD